MSGDPTVKRSGPTLTTTRKRYQLTIPEVGEVILVSPSVDGIKQARATLGTSLAGDGPAFTRTALQATLETPQLTPERIIAIPAEALDILAPQLAVVLGVRGLYDALDPSVAPTERLQLAYRQHWIEALSTLTTGLAQVTLPLQGQMMPWTINGAVADFKRQWREFATGFAVSAANLGATTSAKIGELSHGLRATGRIFADALPVALTAINTWLTREMANTLQTYGWWYAPVLPRELVVEVHEMARLGQGRSINAYICDHYRFNRCSPLRAMINEWYELKYFRVRKPIIEAALKAHRRRVYALSVPALLPQLEGVLRELLEDVGFVERNLDFEIMAQLLGTSQRDMQGAMADSFADALVTIFFGEFAAGQPHTGSLVNRHAVLHGKLVRYASEANSLRTFLMLASLHHFITELLARHSIEQLRKVYANAKREKGDARAAAKAQRERVKLSSHVSPGDE